MILKTFYNERKCYHIFSRLKLLWVIGWISKFPSYSFKKIVIQRKTTIFLLFGIVLFFGFLLIYPFVAISMSAIAYLFMLPISYFHYKKLKKQNDDKDLEDDDFEDIL